MTAPAPPITAVTGATGFLGKRLCAALVARGEPVVALGRRFEGFPDLDRALCRRRVVALADEVALGEAFRGADSVIHAAAMSAIWGRRRDFLSANVDGTAHVLAAARAAGVRRVVHVSSSGVTFDGRDRRDVNEDEPRPRRFLSHYQETKALAEDVVRGATGAETVIVRPRGIFGPGDTMILPRLIARARRGKLRVLGAGRNVQDITYVDNVVAALLLARAAPAAAGRVYLVSNGEPVALWEFIRDCLQGLGMTLAAGQVSSSIAFAVAGAAEALHRVVPGLGEPPLTRYVVALLARDQTLDITAARRDLGYRPEVSMSDALARTIDDFRRRDGAHA
jgi:nucleoside-diphosphate-sugar epimerase